MLQELDNLKKENAAIFSEKEYYLSECEHLKSENLSINNQFGVLTQELTDIKGQLYQAQQELSEAESVVQECVEEKKKLTSVNSNGKNIHYMTNSIHFWKEKLKNEGNWCKVEKILKGSLDSIPSPSEKIQIMSRKVEVQRQNIDRRCQQTFENNKFVDITQQCLALLPQVKFQTIIWIFTEGDGIESRLSS